jgi:pyruvate dehydrogenase E1 component beta subunit
MESETLYNVKGEVPDDPDLLVPMGVSEREAREGTDVTIVAWSRMVHVSLEAAARSRRGDLRRGHRPAEPAPARR